MPPTSTFAYYDNSLDTRSTAFRVALGYSRDSNPNFGFGAELGYNNYGSQTYQGYTLLNYQETLEYKYSAIDLLGKLTWHISKFFDLYGKFGITNEMVKVSGNSDISNNQGVLPEVGFGTSYFATENVSVDLAFYYTQGNGVEFTYNEANNLPSIFAALLGVSYYFG